MTKTFAKTMSQRKRRPLTPTLSPEGERECGAWMPKVDPGEKIFSTEQLCSQPKQC